MIVCSYHVTYAFQSESTLYSCLNVKELLVKAGAKFWNLSDFNWTRTHNHLVHKRTLNHLAKLAKWLWVRVQLQSLKFQNFAPASSKEFLEIQATVECGLTLKRVRDMIRTYNQLHRTGKYSQHSSIIWPVWLNGWVFVYELSGCGFESSCSSLKFQNFAPASSKEFLDIQATIECGFTLKRVRGMIRTHSQMHRTGKYSQHSSIIWPVWLNGWVFVYELSGCGFESSCSHSQPIFTHILFDLRPDSSKRFWNSLVIVMPFLSFNRTNQVYLQ